MPLFFIVSGYFFNANKSFRYFITKIKDRLIIPYFCCLFFELIYCSIIEKVFPFKKILQNSFPICGATWFLLALFFIEILAYFIVKITKNTRFELISLAFISVLGIVAAIFIFNNSSYDFFYNHRRYLSIQPANAAFAFFFAGYVWNKIEKRWPQIVLPSVFISIPFLLITFFTIHANGLVNLRTGIYNKPLLFYFNGILTTCAWLNLFRGIIFIAKSNPKIIILLSYIGVNSLCFMMANQFIIKFIFPLIWKVKIVNFSNICAKLFFLLIILIFWNEFLKRIGLGWTVGNSRK